MQPIQEDLERTLGYRFNDRSLLQRALTHSSCDSPEGNNQRLEFLGDAVLDLIIAAQLFARFPGADEGDLDRGRASLVNGRSLAVISDRAGISDHLIVGEAHRKHHPEPSRAMLEDALEALIGAVFLDGGFEAARQTVESLLGEDLDKLELDEAGKNPKGRLQEWSQREHDGAVPLYEALDAEGPDHERYYTALVSLNGKELGRGRGRSKKAAEAAAAEAALKKVL
jgi:ribonuclease-3